jgi:hypothetical protein
LIFHIRLHLAVVVRRLGNSIGSSCGGAASILDVRLQAAHLFIGATGRT